MRAVDIYVVDAFANEAFRGNPAGVCLLGGSPADDPVTDSWMQLVAAEMRHSETAFVAPCDRPDADYELRWFTPLTEVALCGHATLAAAHVLFEQGHVPPARPVRFLTRRSGILTVRHRGATGMDMEFPAQPATPAEPPDGLAAALGAPVLWTGRNAQSDVLALVAAEETVRRLDPDLEALRAIEARVICVTAAGSAGAGAATDGAAGGHDFVSRVFGPRVGVPEDPVTGSAHCMLGPFWSGRLGRPEVVGFQASERGGTVRVTVDGDRVTLSGHAVTVLSGRLSV